MVSISMTLTTGLIYLFLGDIDYVRTAVAAARKGFADAGGNPEELT